MGSTGRLFDTYVAALQHGLSDVPDDAALVGVVRKPTRRFNAVVDENIPALGPPADLLDAIEREREDLEMRGMCDEGAHNAAWENLNFAERYRDYLSESEAAQDSLDLLATRLAGGEDLALVCYENTGKKRCHRTILREELESRI